MPVFSVLLLFLLMYLTSPPSSPSLPLPPLSSRQSHQIADSSSPLPLCLTALSLPPSPSLRLPPTSLSAYCRALMSTLARSVNYSITGRRISDSPHPPLPPPVIPKIDSYVGSESFTAIRNRDAHCPTLIQRCAADLTQQCEILG